MYANFDVSTAIDVQKAKQISAKKRNKQINKIKVIEPEEMRRQNDKLDALTRFMDLIDKHKVPIWEDRWQTNMRWGYTQKIPDRSG